MELHDSFTKPTSCAAMYMNQDTCTIVSTVPFALYSNNPLGPLVKQLNDPLPCIKLSRLLNQCVCKIPRWQGVLTDLCPLTHQNNVGNRMRIFCWGISKEVKVLYHYSQNEKTWGETSILHQSKSLIEWDRWIIHISLLNHMQKLFKYFPSNMFCILYDLQLTYLMVNCK